MALTNYRQTYDLQTKLGERVTFTTSYNKGDYSDSQQFYFIKEDILKKILNKYDMSLIWIMSGERELTFEEFNNYRRNTDFSDIDPKFQMVQVYK